MATVITVKQLNSYVKSLIEGDSNLNTVYVSGEISNCKSHFASGHVYFTLKDNDAAIKAVMFKMNASRLKFRFEDGMKVICRGRVSVYDKEGQYQLYCEDIKPDGAGSLAIAYEQLKAKLNDEGLFNPLRKRPIPKFPKKIAIVTSMDAAALRDILNILTRRYPLIEVLLVPVQVQGDTAAPGMVRALDLLYTRDDIDTVIIGRGGGSIEDLWAFNDERLARKLFESPFPVISAVGHETDFTICDFVSDLRAPTPSAAAELAVPDISVLKSFVDQSVSDLKNSLVNVLNTNMDKLDRLSKSSVLTDKTRLLEPYMQQTDLTVRKLVQYYSETVSRFSLSLSESASKLDALSPLKVISRGYAIVNTSQGNTIKSVDSVKVNDNLIVRLSDGEIDCTVNSTKKLKE